MEPAFKADDSQTLHILTKGEVQRRPEGLIQPFSNEGCSCGFALEADARGDMYSMQSSTIRKLQCSENMEVS